MKTNKSSYQKLAKMRDETEFELKTIKKMLWIYNKIEAYDRIKNELENLFKLYEIE